MRSQTFAGILVATAAGSVAAGLVPEIDGTLDDFYGPQNVLQNTGTQFGNSTMGQAGYANGSELDGGAVKVHGTHLYLHLAGNLESNHNKLEVFIDARDDNGQNRILGINPDVGGGALQRLGDDGSGNGLTFDDAFGADLYLSINCGDAGDGSGINYWVDYAELRTDGDGAGAFAGSGSTLVDEDGNVTITPSTGDYGIQVAINNSNVGGVVDGTGLDCGAPGDDVVTTGVEISIPLAIMDWNQEGVPFNRIKVCAFVNNADHSWMSNQVLGGLGGSENLQDPRSVNFNDIPGDQYFESTDVADPCVGAPVGACCFANGECWEGVSTLHCDGNRGLHMGDGTGCVDCDLGGGPDDCPSDVDDDGSVNVDDLLQIISDFGSVCP